MATLNEMIAQGAQFNIPDPVAQYNKLAQMQQYKTQNELSQQEAIDKATERQRLVSDRTRRATFLTGLSAKLAEKGHTLDRDTLVSMMSSGIPDIEKLAFEGFKALSADEAFNKAEGNPSEKTAPAPAPMAMGGAPVAPAPAAAALSPTAQASIDDMVSRGIPREAITTGPEGQVYVGSYGSNVVGEPTMEQYRTPEGSLATRPQAPLTPLRVADNQMAPSPVSAMAPQAPAAAAPQSELQRLIDRRDNLSRISDQTPRVKTNIENLNKDIERLSRTKEKINVIGVAKGTGNPVYLDSISDEQYTYVTDAEGKQKRKLYSGPVDRSTSNVSQNVSNKVDTFIPASETVQAELMKELRVTFNALKNAQPTLDNIEAAKALVPTAKGFMGVGGEPLLAAASFLNNRLGTKIDTQGVTDANVLRSRLFFGILDNLKKLDSQPSQSQQAAMQEALGSLGTDPNALGRVLDAFGDSIRTKVDSFNMEVSDAETRGIKFPYSATLKIKPKIGGVTEATTAHPPDIQAIINAQKGK